MTEQSKEKVRILNKCDECGCLVVKEVSLERVIDNTRNPRAGTIARVSTVAMRKVMVGLLEANLRENSPFSSVSIMTNSEENKKVKYIITANRTAYLLNSKMGKGATFCV